MVLKNGTRFCGAVMKRHGSSFLELELVLTQTRMAQKPLLWVEVVRARRAEGQHTVVGWCGQMRVLQGAWAMVLKNNTRFVKRL